jgi:hypothetical protein
MSEGKKTGRPRKEVDWDKVDRMCAIHCTGEEQASILDMSYETLNTRCHEEKGMSFLEYFKQKSADGKMSLRRKQFTAAMDGNTTMLVWLGKNWLGQKDTAELDVKELPQININVMPSESDEASE